MEPLGPGNIGGRTRAFVIRPDRPAVMWAGGVSGGIWKSTDRGRSWRPVGDQLANLAINVLRLDPSDPRVLYAGTGEGYFREAVRGTALPLRGGGIFRSDDGGASWQRLPGTDRGRFFCVNDLLVSRHDPRRIYAATRQGVFRTGDGGESWQQVLNPKVRGGCLDLVERTDARRNDFLLAGCGTLAPGAVWRNVAAETDRAWEKVLAEPGMARTSLAVAPSRQSTVYALAASNVPGPNGRFEQALHAVYRSDQGGAAGSWRATVRNTDPDKISTLLLSNPITASLVECGFDARNDFFAMGWYVNVIAVDPGDPERVWAGGVDIFRSDDGGASWRPASYWWADEDQPQLRARRPARRWSSIRATARRSTCWATAASSAPTTRGRRSATSANAHLLAGRQRPRLAVAQQQLRGDAVLPRLGLPGRQGLYRRRPGQRHGARPARQGHQRLVRDLRRRRRLQRRSTRHNPSNIYVSTQGGQVRRSVNGGISFADATDGITDLGGGGDFTARPDNYLFITPFVMDPNQPSRLWIGGRRLFRTDNGADAWSPASAELAADGKVSALAVAPGDSDRVLAGTSAGDVFRTDIAHPGRRRHRLGGHAGRAGAG